MDKSNFKNGRVHFRNLGMNGFTNLIYEKLRIRLNESTVWTPYTKAFRLIDTPGLRSFCRNVHCYSEYIANIPFSCDIFWRTVANMRELFSSCLLAHQMATYANNFYMLVRNNNMLSRTFVVSGQDLHYSHTALNFANLNVTQSGTRGF